MGNSDQSHKENTEDVDRALTSKEAAKMLRIHPATLLHLAKQGKIPGGKVGARWRFSRTAITKYLDKTKIKHSMRGR